MTVDFLEARHDQCRRPLWADSTPIGDRMVCGAPTLPTKSYCGACRTVLIAGVIKDGRTTWFNGGRRTMAVSAPVEEGDASDDNPADVPVDLLDDVLNEAEAEPEGDRPLLPSELYDWGTAA